MSSTRRQFLAGSAAVAAGMMTETLPAQQAARPGRAADIPFRLGIVTYNIAATWDIPTILRVCRNVGLSPVELRTTHAHGVEPTLNAAQRQEVRQRFADAGIEIW